MQTPNVGWMIVRPLGVCERTELYQVYCLDADANVQILTVPMRDAMEMARQFVIGMDEIPSALFDGDLRPRLAALRAKDEVKHVKER